MGKLAGITNRYPAPNYVIATDRPLLIPVTPGALRGKGGIGLNGSRLIARETLEEIGCLGHRITRER